MLHHPGRDIRIEKLWHYKPDREIIRKTLRIGVPHGIESSMFQFGRPATQVLISGMGIMGVWVAMAGDWVVRAALYTTRFLQNTWLKKGIKAN